MLDTISSPTLLIDERKVGANLQRMADRARRHGLAFRPHVKTHQSAIVGAWCRAAGVQEITVTSLRMAEDFAGHGCQDITIGMPANPREIAQLAALSRKVRLSVFLTSSDVAATLAGANLPATVSYFIEVDAGYGRSGINWTNEAKLRDIITAAGNLRFRGLYVHSGHTYDAERPEDIAAIHQRLLQRLASLRKSLQDLGEFEISIGDTPACSTQEDFRGVTSIGPGNFVYYDLVQTGLGACTEADIAVCLAAPVVQVIPARGEVIVHAGWVQLGKDRLKDGSYGRIVRLAADGRWSASLPGASVVKLSQEHGTVRMPPEILRQCKPGDLLGILPVHACAMVHGMRATGEQIIIPKA